MSEFHAMILLSGFAARSDFREKIKPDFLRALAGGRLSLERATFGTWKCLVEFLGGRLRKLLKEDEDEALRLLQTRNAELAEALAHKGLAEVLNQSVMIRNAHAHGGIVSSEEALRRHSKLNQLVEAYREIIGISWSGTNLVLPGSIRLTKGTYVCRVQQVMGTRHPFQTTEISTSEPLEENELYLKSIGVSRCLRLLPFVRIMPSPRTEQNACYFYNKVEKDKLKFQSYHFVSEPEVFDRFDETAKAIAMLTEEELGPN